MDFNFSEQQTMLADAARMLLDDTCTLAQLRALMDQGEAIDQQRWQALADNGLAAVLLPESAGGLNLTAQDFIQIAQYCGYVALPEPLVEHAGIAAPLLAACDERHPLLEQAAAGQGRLAVGHSVNPLIANADTATALLLAHQGEVHLVSPEQVQLIPQSSIIAWTGRRTPLPAFQPMFKPIGIAPLIAAHYSPQRNVWDWPSAVLILPSPMPGKEHSSANRSAVIRRSSTTLPVPRSRSNLHARCYMRRLHSANTMIFIPVRGSATPNSPVPKRLISPRARRCRYMAQWGIHGKWISIFS